MAWISTTKPAGTNENYWFPEQVIMELRTQTSSGTHVPFSFGIEDTFLTLGRTPNHFNGDERVQAETISIYAY